MENILNWFLSLFLFPEPQQAARVVAHRNYSAGPYDFAEVS